MTRTRATIVQREDVTTGLFCLWLQPQTAFTFKAGQYATIGLNGIERPYSIVSAPCEPMLELFIELVPPERGGKLTPLLHSRRVGDTVTIRPQAKGRFTLRRHVTHHVTVATVTGIAPYVSMIRQFLHDHTNDTARRDGPRFFVLHGASYQDEFVYDRELRRLSEASRPRSSTSPA
jgi:ferredoxin--NADP+ reductase